MRGERREGDCGESNTRREGKWRESWIAKRASD